MGNHQDLLNIAIDLSRQAGGILQQGRADGFGAVETKSSSVDIVTAIDKASEAFIVEALSRLRPHDGVLGEEGTSFSGTSGVKWIIDPLDGTVNFTYGFPLYCVSIGVEVDTKRVAGAVFNPQLDEMFSAAVGSGAYLNGQRLRTNTESDLAQALVATGFSYMKERRQHEATALGPVLPEVRDIRRSGSAALDLCAVACGRVDGYFERAVHPWDVAAGDVIAREAGALVTGLVADSVATIDICAANPVLHSKLQALATTS